VSTTDGDAFVKTTNLMVAQVGPKLATNYSIFCSDFANRMSAVSSSHVAGRHCRR